jgi:hypothetical protein
MQGIFYCEGEYRYTPTDIDGDLLLYGEVVMEMDLGPFKKGEKVSSVTVNSVTGEATMLSTDEDGNDVMEHWFHVDMKYKVRDCSD